MERDSLHLNVLCLTLLQHLMIKKNILTEEQRLSETASVLLDIIYMVRTSTLVCSDTITVLDVSQKSANRFCPWIICHMIN